MRKSNKEFNLILIFLFSLLFGFLNAISNQTNNNSNNNNKSDELLPDPVLKLLLAAQNDDNGDNNQTSNVKIFPLESDLMPKNVYETIECIDSLKLIVKTKICMHDPKHDSVSQSIKRLGIFEHELFASFLDVVNKNPDCLIIDIGANIGQYSLFAAKMNRKVVAVEPFIDNIYRIHKAAKLENVESNIVLIQNALWNRRNQLREMRPVDANIAAQRLTLNVLKNVRLGGELNNNKYLVETILLDDLVEHLPLRSDGSPFSRAIIKIDIEGHETFAFEKASKLFDRLDIIYIQMEWRHLIKNSLAQVNEMMQFLTERGFNPYFFGVQLNRKNFKEWPFDVAWIKSNEKVIANSLSK